ncbi:MAG TPA: FAD-dependent oxidoreductase [Segetibacter sp.]|jgi:glycine/D-amino acid oxidase-like deaminating enzyme/nitrite reductase/ring-hydroxylating ferredoxin subunit
MGNPSIWKEKAESTSFAPLRNNIHVDVAIVGGGITGLTAAYLLSKAGKKVAVLEARKIGEGATGYSTGNLYSTIGGEGLHTVKSKFDEERMKEVVESRTTAINLIEQIINEYQIQCDFERVPWYLFTEDGVRQSFVEKERKAAETCGLAVSDQIPFNTPVAYGFGVANQAQFNPLQYVVGLAKSIHSESCMVYELTSVTDAKDGEPCTLTTAGGTVTATKVIMATHSPKGIYLVHTSLGPYREYALGVKLNEEYPAPGIYWDMRETEHYSMRTYETPKGKILMVLGEMHKVGQKENNEECFENLEAFLRERFKVASIEYKWSAQQFKPADSIPFIGLSSGNKNIYIATGFAADGLTYGTLASMIISDEISGIQNKWSKTYSASRITPIASATEFIKENVNVAAELIKDYLAKEDIDKFSELAIGDGKIIEIEGKKRGAYRGEDGRLHVVSAVCTHMGCIVHFNQTEKSWDCPCHGSRFSVDGEVLEGPAFLPLKKSIANDEETKK